MSSTGKKRNSSSSRMSDKDQKAYQSALQSLASQTNHHSKHSEKGVMISTPGSTKHITEPKHMLPSKISHANKPVSYQDGSPYSTIISSDKKDSHGRQNNQSPTKVKSNPQIMDKNTKTVHQSNPSKRLTQILSNKEQVNTNLIRP